VSDAGGSKRSYKNGRVQLFRGRGHPLPQGPPKSSVGGDEGGGERERERKVLLTIKKSERSIGSVSV
jgi:hypothetical protein